MEVEDNVLFAKRRPLLICKLEDITSFFNTDDVEACVHYFTKSLNIPPSQVCDVSLDFAFSELDQELSQSGSSADKHWTLSQLKKSLSHPLQLAVSMAASKIFTWLWLQLDPSLSKINDHVENRGVGTDLQQKLWDLKLRLSNSLCLADVLLESCSQHIRKQADYVTFLEYVKASISEEDYQSIFLLSGCHVEPPDAGLTTLEKSVIYGHVELFDFLLSDGLYSDKTYELGHSRCTRYNLWPYYVANIDSATSRFWTSCTRLVTYCNVPNKRAFVNHPFIRGIAEDQRMYYRNWCNVHNVLDNVVSFLYMLVYVPCLYFNVYKFTEVAEMKYNNVSGLKLAATSKSCLPHIGSLNSSILESDWTCGLLELIMIGYYFLAALPKMVSIYKLQLVRKQLKLTCGQQLNLRSHFWLKLNLFLFFALLLQALLRWTIRAIGGANTTASDLPVVDMLTDLMRVFTCSSYFSILYCWLSNMIVYPCSSKKVTRWQYYAMMTRKSFVTFIFFYMFLVFVIFECAWFGLFVAPCLLSASGLVAVDKDTGVDDTSWIFNNRYLSFLNAVQQIGNKIFTLRDASVIRHVWVFNSYTSDVISVFVINLMIGFTTQTLTNDKVDVESTMVRSQLLYFSELEAVCRLCVWMKRKLLGGLSGGRSDDPQHKKCPLANTFVFTTQKRD